MMEDAMQGMMKDTIQDTIQGVIKDMMHITILQYDFTVWFYSTIL